MSFDVYLEDPVTGENELETPLDLRGGTYAVGGTTEAWLNITHNYSPFFFRNLGKEGLRGLGGKTAKDCRKLLGSVVGMMRREPSDDYWEPSEGNAKVALHNLLTLCRAVPDEWVVRVS